MAHGRNNNDGDRYYVINPSIPEKNYLDARKLAIHAGSPMTAIIRTALILGLARMETELGKHERGEDSKWEGIKEVINRDGRKKRVVKEV